MSKYTEEFRRNAIEFMKKAGITKACKELKVSHCTLYRWCKEMEGGTVIETEEPVDGDLDAMLEKQADESKQENGPVPSASEDESSASSDTVATAMAMLVIENTHLREIIRHLRDTIAGLTDHKLL